MTSDSGDGVDPAHAPAHRNSDIPSVSCPNGHLNAWDYKFCGSCGAPIGVVAWPAEHQEDPEAQARSTPRVAIYTGVVAFAVVLLALGTAAFVVSRPSADGQLEGFPHASSAGTTSASAGPMLCQTAPTLQVESMDLTTEGLEIQAAFSSPCGADVESNSALVVTAAEGERDVAAASFDFSELPLIMEPGVPGRRTLVFPRGMFWRTPAMLSAAPVLVANRQGVAGSPAASSTAPPASVVAAAVAKPAFGSIDGVAKAVLEELHAADMADIRLLTLGWVPQISSKRVGLKAAGKTWTSADILEEHLELRRRFPGARLVWSGDWSTFSHPDFWVTVVGPSRRSPFEANSWCDAQGFAEDDCFAKFVSSVYGVPGTTVYRE